jgi:hypothetical protein
MYKTSGSRGWYVTLRPSSPRRRAMLAMGRSGAIYRRAAMDVIRGSPTEPELTTSPLTGTESSSLVTRRTTLQGSVVTMTSQPLDAWNSQS